MIVLLRHLHNINGLRFREGKKGAIDLPHSLAYNFRYRFKTLYG